MASGSHTPGAGAVRHGFLVLAVAASAIPGKRTVAKTDATYFSNFRPTRFTSFIIIDPFFHFMRCAFFVIRIADLVSARQRATAHIGDEDAFFVYVAPQNAIVLVMIL